MNTEFFILPKLNKEQYKYYTLYANRRSLALLRLSLVVIFIATLAFFYLDYISAPEHYHLFWLMRGFFELLIVLTFYLTYRQFFIKNFQIIANILNIFYCLIVLLMIYFSSPNEISYTTYYTGLLIIWISTIPMRIRLKPYLINAALIGTLYVLLAIFKQHMLEEENVHLFVSNMFFFFSTFIAVLTADWVLEMFMRNNFLSEQLLIEQNAELEQKNFEISAQNEEINRQKQIIEKRHKQIVESIHYAQTIQGAILPSSDVLDKLLGKYFVIYKPKQYVSGDFYYVTQRNKYKIVAVGDCTGHGVPGGFLAMLSISKIDNIIFNCKDLTQPSEILEHLRSEIKRSLWSTKDGLDIALCIIDTQENKLYFSGAYNPAVVMREEQQFVLDAVKSPIGKYPKEQKFVTHAIKLKPNDTIYLYSDGLPTQRSKENLPYGSRRFKEKIKFISQLPLED